MSTGMARLSALAVLLLSACSTTTPNSAGGDPEAVAELPESVVLMAAPDQDLTSVRLRAEDGCYWYRWVGPVETSYVPLRTTDGRPICTVAQGQAPVSG